MEYLIVSRKSERDLEYGVNAKINQGWVPQGGMSMVIIGDSAIFYQAMIKKT